MTHMTYESTRKVSSAVCAGVKYTIARMTFGRRIELMRSVRELTGRHEFERAGSSIEDRVQASLTAAAIDQLYLNWGLISIEGLEVDGRLADPQTVALCGPEALCREIIQAIKHECALTEDELKN